jgi:hypothetical protein
MNRTKRLIWNAQSQLALRSWKQFKDCAIAVAAVISHPVEVATFVDVLKVKPPEKPTKS